MVETKLYREGDRFLIDIPSLGEFKRLCTLVQISPNRFMLICEGGNRLVDFQKQGLSVNNGLVLSEVLEIIAHKYKDAKILEINGVKLNPINFKKGDVFEISYGTSFDRAIIYYDETCYRLVVVEATNKEKVGSCLMICGKTTWSRLDDLNENLNYVSNIAPIKKVSI